MINVEDDVLNELNALLSSRRRERGFVNEMGVNATRQHTSCGISGSPPPSGANRKGPFFPPASVSEGTIAPSPTYESPP